MDRYFEDLLPLSHVFGLIRGTMSVLYTGGLWVSGADLRYEYTYDDGGRRGNSHRNPASYGRVYGSRMGRCGELFQGCPCTGECHSAFNPQNSKAYCP